MNSMYQLGAWNELELIGLGTIPSVGILILLLWALAWKGWALWLAARRGETIWFVVLLVINTLGLLELFYIFVIAKRRDERPEVYVNHRHGKHERIDSNLP